MTIFSGCIEVQVDFDDFTPEIHLNTPKFTLILLPPPDRISSNSKYSVLGIQQQVCVLV